MAKNEKMMHNRGCDILIIGAGITGLTIARELISRGSENIWIIEKEEVLGAHASGRNSGVLHAGIYYTPDSLKAKFCVEGNRLMRQYCHEHNLPLFESGKVVVARNESELSGLVELKKRADGCGATTELIDTVQLAEIEPYAKTCLKALYSPRTAAIQPAAIMKTLATELVQSYKCTITHGVAFKGLHKDHVAVTSKGNVSFKKFINAAGAYADRVAHTFNIGKQYRILPFKGTYQKLREARTYLVRGSIYPVPDLRNPFLGVHFTRNTEDTVYVGPTAIPAFGRENYRVFESLGMETISILYRDALLLLTNDSFRYSAINEIKKYRAHYFYSAAQSLLPDLHSEDLIASDKVGIRPQLVDWAIKQLVTDFLVLHDSNSIHILNAISPAFTTSMAFARYIVDSMQTTTERRIGE